MKVQLLLRLEVDVSDGMSQARVLEWANYLRPGLEKVSMGGDDDDLFNVVSCVITPGSPDYVVVKRGALERALEHAYTAGVANGSGGAEGKWAENERDHMQNARALLGLSDSEET